MATLRPLPRAASLASALRARQSAGRTLATLSPRYKYADDGSFSREIEAINREEASNPDLFHAPLVARLREDNKRATRAVRTSGWIPSYLRGRGKMPDLMIQVPAAPLARDYEGGFFSKATRGRVLMTGPLYELRVEAGTTDEYGKPLDVSWIPFERARVLVQNVKIHPLDNVPWGMQLSYFPENEPVRIRVPIVVRNREKSPGMRDGGWLNDMVRDVDIKVSPFVKPPSKCVLDISGMKMKDRRYIGDLDFEGKDNGCRIVLPDDTTVAMITKP